MPGWRIVGDDIAQAFGQTLYRVGGCALQIGLACPLPVSEWIARGARTAWIVTADNPGAACCPGGFNQARRQALETWVRIHAFSYLTCVNCDPTRKWPDEYGLLIAGLDEGGARALGRRFGQLAIVAVALERPVELVWLSSQRSE